MKVDIVESDRYGLQLRQLFVDDLEVLQWKESFGDWYVYRSRPPAEFLATFRTEEAARAWALQHAGVHESGQPMQTVIERMDSVVEAIDPLIERYPIAEPELMNLKLQILAQLQGIYHWQDGLVHYLAKGEEPAKV